MIKGCSRQVIVLKNTGSDLFEEAYFIIKPKGSDEKHGDLLLEANRIIRSKAIPAHENKRRNAGIFQLILGFVLGIFVTAPTVYFVFLL